MMVAQAGAVIDSNSVTIVLAAVTYLAVALSATWVLVQGTSHVGRRNVLIMLIIIGYMWSLGFYFPQLWVDASADLRFLSRAFHGIQVVALAVVVVTIGRVEKMVRLEQATHDTGEKVISAP